MNARRVSRLVIAVCAIAVVALGMGITSIAGAAQDPSAQFKNLKTIKEPSPCKNDPGITDTEIKIGTIVPTSGASASSFKDMLDGINARIAKANSEKELGARKITTVNADDAADPARNTPAAQQLVEQEKVFAILTESSAGDASGQYLNSQGIPVVGWQLGLPVWGTYPNYFGFQNANTKDLKTYYTSRQADAIKALGGSKVALVANSTASSATFIEQIADAVSKTKGESVVYKTTDVPAGTTEFGAIADQIKKSGADALYTGMDTLANTGLVTALRQAGVNPKVTIFPGGYDPRVTALPGYDGVYFGIEFKPFESNPPTPGYLDYKQWMTTTKPDAILNQITAVGWLSANTMIEGIKAAGTGCPTRKAFINNLRMEKGYTANGFFDPISFADVYNKPFLCTYYVQVQNKAFVPQFGGNKFCAKQIIRNNKILKIIPTTAPAATATTTAAK